MRIWIVGLLLLGTGFSLIQGQDVRGDDDEYEVKRFHVQSRQLNGSPHCVVSRRKRSPSDEESAVSAKAETDPEMELGVSTAAGAEEPAGILLRDTDLNGKGGILVIQNDQSSAPLLFELRPLPSDADNQEEPYFEIEDDASFPVDVEDQEDIDETDDDDEDDNRFRPASDLESDESEEEVSKKPARRVRPTKKPKRKQSSQNLANKKRKTNKTRRPSIQGSTNKRKPSRKNSKNKSKNQNKNKKRNKKRRKTNNKRWRPTNVYSNKVDAKKRVGLKVDQGSGERTITRTITVTNTGTANDAEDVNCIIINKPAPPTTARPFWDILGRSAGQREADRSFGLRKRINFRRQS